MTDLCAQFVLVELRLARAGLACRGYNTVLDDDQIRWYFRRLELFLHVGEEVLIGKGRYGV